MSVMINLSGEPPRSLERLPGYEKGDLHLTWAARRRVMAFGLAGPSHTQDRIPPST
jgi:hypothetical protein